MRYSFLLLAAICTFLILDGCYSNEHKPFSRNNEVTASILKQSILQHKPSSVVVILSPTCPYHEEFLHDIRPAFSRIVDSTNLVILSDCDSSSFSEQMYQLHKYDLRTDTVLFMDNGKYSSNFLETFTPDGRYKGFLDDMGSNYNDNSLGYPQFFYFQRDSLVGKSYYLNEALWDMIKNNR